ncbi:MAG: aldolase/citrate lyase family protein [Bacteroidota bacterium]|nr:aldolase/citrate lyase family protein [Bacteroidota bacterium]
MAKPIEKDKMLFGNSGPGIRSDCQVSMELLTKGGLEIDLNSKVNSMYGKSIREMLKEILVFFEIKNARVTIQDSGALPFVILARMEALIKSHVKSEKEFLPDMIAGNLYKSENGRFRFSRLYLPGNSPSLMLNAGVHQPGGLILDLEDSVAPEKKYEASFLVRNALRQLDFMGTERMVRINQLPAGLKDLAFIVNHNIHLILVPKCESPEQILQLEIEISRLKKPVVKDDPIFLMPIIESALGVEKAFEIAVSSKNIVAMAIGLEDYTADIGVRRTSRGDESLYARTRLINACKAAGVQPIDSVFSDVGDMEGLREAVRKSRSLGFEGMGCIHPRQIQVIHEEFYPGMDEVDKAARIVKAFKKAKKDGLGVVSLGTKMIDAPVVKRAQKTLDLAVSLGLLKKDKTKESN